MAGTRTWKRTISLYKEDVDFVEVPPKQLTIECPICMGILFDPHLVSCCGYHFCEDCLMKVRMDGMPCPMCKSDYTSLLNKSLKREINQLSVRCPNYSDQCEWMGELGYLEGHLNIGERYGDCQALVIGCKYGCSHSDQRCNLTLHETSECPKRPYSCDYCGDYQSTCEDVTENHWTICKDYPVECPNTCTTRYLSRGKLEEHLDKVCELQEIPCPFHWAGCSVKIQRIKLEEHIKLAMADHLQKICTASCDLIGEVGNLTNSMEELRKEKRAMKLLLSKMERDDAINKQHISDLSSNLHTMTEQLKELEKNNENLKQQIDQVNYENKAEKEQLDKRLLTLESSIGLPPFYFTMTDFQKILAEKTSYFSPPFYTHIGGYRMCIKVTPCGIFFGEDTHVSLTVHIMKGAFDDNLEWPFCGKITIALLDRLNDKDHCVDTITFNKKTSVKASGRVKSGDVMNGNGVVSYNFADLAWLKPNSRRKSCYLPDDSLHFKVLEVTIN